MIATTGLVIKHNIFSVIFKTTAFFICTKIVFILCDLSFSVLFEIQASVIHGYFNIKMKIHYLLNVMLCYFLGAVLLLIYVFF